MVAQLAVPEHYRKAAELFQAGKYKEAETRLHEALLAQPELPEAYYLLGRIFAMTNRPQEAEASLKRALTLRPSFVQAHQLLGMLYCERKEYETARDHLAKALKLDPQNSVTLVYIGQSQEGLNNNSEAMSAYQHAIELSDRYSQIHVQAQDSLGLLHLKLASLYSEAHRLKDSVHHLEQAKELLVPSQEFLNLLGAAFLKVEDPRAVETLRQAAELSSTDESWEKLAKTLSAHHKFDEAVDLFEAKIKERPQSESFHLLLGACYWDKADYFKALEHYQQAKTLNPRSAKAHYLIGSAHLEMGNPSEGQGFLEEAVRLDADLVPANLALARTLIARGRNQEALRFLEKAARQKAEDADIQVKLGQLYLDLKRYDAALNVLTVADRLGPNRKNVHYLLGRLYVETKQRGLAQKEFSIFKNLEAAEKKNRTKE